MLRFSPRVQEAIADANTIHAAGPGSREGKRLPRVWSRDGSQQEQPGQDARDLDPPISRAI